MILSEFFHLVYSWECDQRGWLQATVARGRNALAAPLTCGTKAESVGLSPGKQDWRCCWRQFGRFWNLKVFPTARSYELFDSRWFLSEYNHEFKASEEKIHDLKVFIWVFICWTRGQTRCLEPVSWGISKQSWSMPERCHMSTTTHTWLSDLSF